MTTYIELKDFDQSKASLPSDPRLRIESPENAELGGKINSLRLCVAPASKMLLKYILYIITGFLLYFLTTWSRTLYVLLTFTDSKDEVANWVIIYGADRNIEVVPLLREKTSSKSFKVFHYRLFKYYYDENRRVWKPVQFHFGEKTCEEIHQEFSFGLDETQLIDNSVFYGKNITDIPKKSWLTLLFEEVLTPFYIFQVFSFIIWYMDNYLAYSILIGILSIISIIVTLIDTIKTRSRLREMSYYEIPVNVFRRVNGQQRKLTINSSELVPGDILQIPENVYMPCDAILLHGISIMNEAILTGESIPVIKSSLPHSNNKINPSEEKQHTLYAGVVTLNGFTTMKGELIRTMLFPKPTDFRFYADSFKFILVLGVMAVIGFLIDLPSWIEISKYDQDGEIIRLIIFKAFGLITVAVPPALPTCVQIGVSVALARLKKKQIYCISPNKINEAGQINVMCFDKTGTLTEDGLDLLGVRPVFYDKNTSTLGFSKLINDIKKLSPNIDSSLRAIEIQNYMNTEQNQSKETSIYEKQMFPCEYLLEIMATCHSLTFVNNVMIGDPLDIKMFETTKWTLEENYQEKFGDKITARVRSPASKNGNRKYNSSNEKQKEIGIIRKFEFSSKLQRMSVVVQDSSEENFKMHIKGSPENIRELCKHESIPANFHSVLEKYTEDGYRVLACATRILDYDLKTITSSKREELEKDFNFIGFLIMENRLKPITTQVIDTLHAAEIRTIMVTGDNALTAISVARQCHIVATNQRIFLGDLSETNNKKMKIVWKDFEFSDRKLNKDLELELDYETRHSPISEDDHLIQNMDDIKKLDNKKLNSSAKKNHHKQEKGNLDEISNQGSLLNSSQSDVDAQFIDIDPPFFNLHDHENYCIAVTGKVFSLILHEVEVKKNAKYAFILKQLLKKCLVFARMHPDEKALMIKYMMSIPKNKVGMCGDGANDVCALKAANMGVSLSEAEASIAAPFTSKIQDISCVLRILREGRAALATSYQTFKYMALYAVIQFASFTILYFYLIEFMMWHFYHFDIGIFFLLSTTMVMSGTSAKLTKYKPTGRLISVQILTSVIGMSFIQIFFQVYAFVYLRTQDWFIPNPHEFGIRGPTSESTTIYFVSIFQYCVVALAFIVGRPFRKPFYTNFWFTFALVVTISLNLLVTYNPFDFEILYDEEIGAEARVPMEWRNKIMIIVLINSTVTMLWEKVVVKQVSIRWRKHVEHLEALKQAKENVFKPNSQ